MRGAGAVALAIAACGTEPPAPTHHTPAQAILGRHVYFTAPGDRVVCGGTVPWLDDVAEAQAGALGLTVTRRIDYAWQPDELGCPPGAGGCTDEDRVAIRALYPDMAHELAHAVLGMNGVRAPSFFDEGNAVALDADQGGLIAAPTDAWLAATPIPFDAYASAGDFASYLIDTRGPERWLALLRATRRGDRAATIRAAFADVYAEDLDDAVAERALAQPRVLGVPACMGPSVPWIGDTARAEVRVDCDTGVGPHESRALGSPPTARRTVIFDVPADGRYTISVEGGVALPLPCGAPGRVYVLLEAPVDTPTDFVVTAKLQ